MDHFGKYELVRRLGAGGMAEVFLAKEPLAGGLSKVLVIKKVHAQLAESKQFRQMFEDEAKVTVNLNHPNIVQTFGYGQHDSTFYLTMEHVEGVDLLRLLNASLEAGQRIPYGLGAYLGQQIAKGLDYAHRRTDEYGEALGIVHRDISPQNILVSWDGMVKLVDFGIARARHVKEVEGVVKGKFAYMSPEQAAGEPVDARSDIFSMGIVLWEVATSRTLFGGMKGKQALTAIRAGQIPRPRSVEPTVPAGFEDIIMRALAVRPDDRYTTARDLHRALGTFFFELSAKEGQIFESGAMAAFMARVVPRVRNPPAEHPSAAPKKPAPPPETSAELSSARPVVIVEGELAGMSALRRTVGDSRAREVLLDFLRVTEHIAYKHGANAERVDERGFSYVVGLSGDSEDAPLRAIRLALALIEALDGISRDLHPPLQVAIGVQRGSALVAGLNVSAPRLEYQLVGQTTDVARRLARDAMPSEILVGGGVHRAARDEYRFEELEPIQVVVEGDTDAAASSARARVYRLLGVRPRAERLADVTANRPIVGRRRELDGLRAAYHGAINERRSRNVILVGDAGVGKQSIVEAFRRELPDTTRVIRAVARRSLRETPFSLVAELVREALHVHDDADPREVKRSIETTVEKLLEGDDAREIRQATDAFALLLGVNVKGADEIDPNERRHRLQLSMRLLQRRLAERGPLVVVLEDLHWADGQSYELFVGLVREPIDRAVLCIVTGRPDERTETWALDASVSTLYVSELGPAERRALVENSFADPEDARPLTERILERAGGNPFFIRELLESLTERGVLESDGGKLRWVRREEMVAVPTTVEAVVQGRLERLPPRELELVRRASVLGRIFRADDVAALLEVKSAADVQPELQRLVARGILEPMGTASPEGAVELAFRNLLTKEVAYSGIAPDVRSRLHLAFAKRMAKSQRFRRGADDHRLAEHLVQAGEVAQAGRALIGAALFARDHASNADAFALFTRALTLLPIDAHADRYRVHTEREQILRGWGKRPLQLREVHAMRRAALAAGDTSGEVEALCRLALLYLDVGRHAAAQREVDRALARARETKDATGQSEALRLSASLQLALGRNSAALDLARQALATLDPGPHRARIVSERAALLGRAQALQVVGDIHVLMGRLREAVSTQAEALVIYRRLGTRRFEAQTLSSMGWMLVGLGQYEEALVQYKRSLRLAQELGDRTGIGGKLASIGQAYADLGDLGRAHRYLGKSLELHAALGDQAGLCDARISLSQVLLKEHRYDECIFGLESGLELAVRTRGRYQEIRALIYLAFAHIERGDPPDGALDLARRAVQLAREGEIANGEVYGLCAESVALHRLGRLAEAGASADAAVALIDAGRDVDSPEEIFFHLSVIAAESGATAKAEESLTRAVSEVRKKARRIHDEGWRQRYLASSPAAAILKRAAAR
ncbi:MAG: protein kinase [Polyangia bacterium]